MFDLIGTFVLVVFLALSAWLVKRAWGSKRKILKWIGVPLAGLLTLVLVFVLVTALVGFYQLSTPPSRSVASVKIAGTPEQIARGKYLALILCAGCHSLNNDLPLSGGHNLADDIGLPLGDLYGANLTPAGELKDWSDGEILRALRWGLHKSGRKLAMPVNATSQLSDADAQAIVAYLRSQAPVESKLPATRASLLFGLLIGAGQFDLSAAPDSGVVTAPARGATAEYGQYIVNITDCKTCHGADLTGGKPPAPVGPSLFVVKGWTQAQFAKAVQTGIDPTGDQLDPAVMPWKEIANMDDVDIAAMYTYLHNMSVPK